MKNLRLIIVFIALVLIITGCSNGNTKSDTNYGENKSSNKSQTANIKVTKTDHDVITREDGTDMSIDWELTETSNAEMWFDKKIDLDIRKDIINQTSDILSSIQKRYPGDKKRKYYFSTEVRNCIIGDRIYIKYESKVNLCNFTTRTLYQIFGEECHYGLIYGEAIDLIKSANKYDSKLSHKDIYYLGDADNLDKDSINKLLKNNNEILGLNLSAFSIVYYSVDDINQIKDFDLSFVQYIKDKYGQQEYKELIRSSSDFSLDFDNKYAKYMNEYLKSICCNIEMKEETVPIRYCDNGDKDFPIIICTKYMNYFFKSDFSDVCFQTRKLYDSKYDSGKSFIFILDNIKLMEKEMADVRNYLCIDDKLIENKRIKAYFLNDTQCTVRGMMRPYADNQNENIVCYSFKDFIHEYTHIITLPKYYKFDDNRCIPEGIATYMGINFDTLYRKTIANDYANDKDEEDKELNEKFKFYLSSKGKENVLNDKEAIYEYFEFVSYYEYLKSGEEMYKDLDFYHYVFGPVFSKYLVINYGVDKNIYAAHSKNEDFKKIYGASLEDEQKEFIDYLAKKYSKYLN